MNLLLHQIGDPIFPPNTVYLPRTSFVPYGCIDGAAEHFDGRLCPLATFRVPVSAILPEGVFHPDSLALLAASGLPVPSPEQALIYRNREEFEAFLRAAPDGSLIVDHPHPPEALPPAKYYVPYGLISRLIDKGCLHEWVPEEILPPRMLIPRKNWHAQVQAFWISGQRHFLKLTGPVPSGGSATVWPVDRLEDLASMIDSLPGEGPVVLERGLKTDHSFCVNFVLSRDPAKAVRLIGAATQWIDGEGFFLGSLIPPLSEVPGPVLQAAASVARDIQAAGYEGLLGLDVLGQGGQAWVIDLNPRINFSTTPLLLASMAWASGDPQARFAARSVQIPRNALPRALPLLHRKIAEKQLQVYRAYTLPPGEELAMRLGIFFPANNAQAAENILEEFLSAGMLI